MVVPPSCLCGGDCTVCGEGCAESGKVGGSSRSIRCGSRPFSPVQTWIGVGVISLVELGQRR